MGCFVDDAVDSTHSGKGLYFCPCELTKRVTSWIPGQGDVSVFSSAATTTSSALRCTGRSLRLHDDDVYNTASRKGAGARTFRLWRKHGEESCEDVYIMRTYLQVKPLFLISIQLQHHLINSLNSLNNNNHYSLQLLTTPSTSLNPFSSFSISSIHHLK